MLYRDYSREWIPNVYGARENPEAMISFFILVLIPTLWPHVSF